MQNFLKIASGLNVLPIQMALMRNQHLFGQITDRAASYVHTQMTDIWVRYNAYENMKGDPVAFNEDHDSVWYPAYYALPELRPLIFWLMAHVEGERLGAVLITRVPPGGKIEPHIDKGWHAEYYEKYYIPIQNDPGAVFKFEDGVIAPDLGDVYWFHNGNLHAVENNSSRDRIALIVCIRSHKFKGESPCR